MYKYTLCFIVKNNKVLMLNRNKAPWMGCWNGLGGKLELGESPMDCIKREIQEEAPITLKDIEIIPNGIVTWNDEKFGVDGGLYLFIAKYLNEDFDQVFPQKTREGILEIKDIEWVTNINNFGVSHNIRYFLQNSLDNEGLFEYKCTFKNNALVNVVTIKIDDNYFENIKQ